jgi:hypothetical protein
MAGRAKRWLADPTLHFFVAGALLFAGHRLVVGAPRTITVTKGLRADLERRFRDHNGRKPSAAEIENTLSEWKRDEALYREALREQLDRDDATIRSVLADKMRARAALEIPKPTPSDAELERWLGAHQKLYETPRRYDYESIAFGKSDPDRERELERFEGALAAGARAASLGRPVIGGRATADELRGRVGADIAERIPALPLGRWQRLENGDDVLLVRVNRVEGGPPSVHELRPRLIADFTYSVEQQAIERAIRRIVDRYRFEEQP